jgi:hypothetical protein
MDYDEYWMKEFIQMKNIPSLIIKIIKECERQIKANAVHSFWCFQNMKEWLHYTMKLKTEVSYHALLFYLNESPQYSLSVITK